MMLVTGPTGSGKTTTLYAALNQINQAATQDHHRRGSGRVPSAAHQPGAGQSKIGLDFARVLRTALRQDPDVIMVGEMRDRETAEIGLRAAMTGHLVLSTLHTNSAPATVMRLLDMGAQGFMVAAALDGVIAQRLVRRVCDSCGADVNRKPQSACLGARPAGEEAVTAWFRAGRGCAYCSNTGYRGRIGVYELLEMDQELTDSLRRMDTEKFTN
jgi:MSHA biogenesis protein MshE